MSQPQPPAGPTLCVFCGAKSGNDPRWVVGAFEFGVAMAKRGWRLVYGGGRVGLMGAIADGALSVGGEAVGVIPARLMDRELAHHGLARLEVVSDMAVRKQRMIELSDAFVALPGGLGTLDELFEILTLRQIGEHEKPTALLDQHGYWQPLLHSCAAMIDAGFVQPDHLSSLIVESTPDTVLDAIERALADGLPRADVAA